jgi:hypothetical protein
MSVAAQHGKALAADGDRVAIGQPNEARGQGAHHAVGATLLGLARACGLAQAMPAVEGLMEGRIQRIRVEQQGKTAKIKAKLQIGATCLLSN